MQGEPSGFPSARRVSKANGANTLANGKCGTKQKTSTLIVEVLLCVGALHIRFRAGCADGVGGLGFFKDDDAARLTPCKEDDAEKGKTDTTDACHERKRICCIFPGRAARSHKKRKKHLTFRLSAFPCWRLPIFPGRYQPSIVSASELNCRVRDGNGCTLTAISTNLFQEHVLFFQDHTLKTE